LILVAFDDAEASGLPESGGKLGQCLVGAVSFHVPVQNVCGNRTERVFIYIFKRSLQ
jgi:hypothetical protein